MEYKIINIEGLTYAELEAKKNELVDDLDLHLDIIKDQANRRIGRIMPNGWGVRYVSHRCIGLYCNGIASTLDLMVEDPTEKPNDFTMNVAGAGTFSATEEGEVRNYYLGVAYILTDIDVREAILSTFAHIFKAFYYEEDGVVVDIQRSIYAINRRLHEMRKEGLV